MRKLLLAVIGLAAVSAPRASTLTYTDIYNPTDILLSNSGLSSYTFTHDILDNGFNPATNTILSADIYISMMDDSDRASENVRITLDDLVVAHSLDVDAGAYHFTVNSSLLQDDGKLVVNLNVLSGDFYFQQSELDVTATDTAPAPVPEPGSMALMGLGVVGMGLVARRKRI